MVSGDYWHIRWESRAEAETAKKSCRTLTLLYVDDKLQLLRTSLRPRFFGEPLGYVIVTFRLR